MAQGAWLRAITCVLLVLPAGNGKLFAGQGSLETELKKSTPSERLILISRLLEDRHAGNGDSLRHYIDRIRSFAQDHRDQPLLEEVVYLDRIKSTFKETDAEKRLAVFERLLETEYRDHPVYRGRCLHQIGQNQFVLQNYAQAFENMVEAQNLFLKKGYAEIPGIGRFLHDLALDYYYFRNYKEVIQLMREAVKLPPVNGNLDIQRYNTLGMAYLRKGLQDSALVYFKETAGKADQYRDSTWQGLAAGNLGSLHLDNKNYEMALPYLLKNYQISVAQNGYREIMANACSALGRFYLETDSLEKAYHYIGETRKYFPDSKTLQFGEEQQFEISKKAYFKNQLVYYRKTGNLRMALNYLDSLGRAEKWEIEKYNSVLVKLTEGKLQIRDNMNRIALQEQEKANLQLRYSLYILLLFLLAVSGYLLFYMNVIKKRRERALYEARHTIIELEKNKAESELRTARAVLDSFVKKVSEKNALIGQITETLEKLEMENFRHKNEWESSLEKLRSTKILTSEDWDVFRKNFDTVYPDFARGIRLTFPQITPSELRYLMLSKLGLTHPEMAHALGVSADTIRVTWNRVRKKTNTPVTETPQSLHSRLSG